MRPPVTDFIAREAQFGAHNYAPLGVVLTRGEGVWVWDTDGNRYLDCLSAYSAVNQGHCHPKILAAMIEQAGRLTLTLFIAMFERDHGPLARGMARGASALIQDLKQRGLLDDTLVVWGGEFGRTPFAQSSDGRDHNPFGFSVWLAGGGIKGGVSYGPSDEWGFKPADRSHFTQGYDIHATVLHLLGLDHTRMELPALGPVSRLVERGGPIREILA